MHATAPKQTPAAHCLICVCGSSLDLEICRHHLFVPQRICITVCLQTVDVTLKHPTTTSSLVHVMGISSSEMALNKQPSNRLTANLFNGQMASYWNLWDYKQHEYLFVDGGEGGA